MNTIIVILFGLQVLVVITATFALVLVYNPIKRLFPPVIRLVQVVKMLIETTSGLLTAFRKALTSTLNNFSRIANLVKRRTSSSKARLTVSKVFSILVTGKRLLALLKLFKHRRRNRFWGMFRLFMLAGPMVVPVLSSLKKIMRKPA